jgi:hypothetical protein
MFLRTCLTDFLIHPALRPMRRSRDKPPSRPAHNVMANLALNKQHFRFPLPIHTSLTLEMRTLTFLRSSISIVSAATLQLRSRHIHCQLRTRCSVEFIFLLLYYISFGNLLAFLTPCHHAIRIKPSCLEGFGWQGTRQTACERHRHSGEASWEIRNNLQLTYGGR